MHEATEVGRRTRGRAHPGPRAGAPGTAILQGGPRAQRTGRKPGGETEGAREGGGGEEGPRKDGTKERRKLCCVCIPSPSSPPSWPPTPQIEVPPPCELDLGPGASLSFPPKETLDAQGAPDPGFWLIGASQDEELTPEKLQNELLQNP